MHLIHPLLSNQNMSLHTVWEEIRISSCAAFWHRIPSCTVRCWNKHAALTSTAARHVAPDTTVWQLLLHLLLNCKQSITSVHLCCWTFGVCHVDAYTQLTDSHPGTLERLDSSCLSFDPEGEQSRINNINTVLCLTTYTSTTINTPLYSQSGAQHYWPSEAHFQISSNLQVKNILLVNEKLMSVILSLLL